LDVARKQPSVHDRAPAPESREALMNVGEDPITGRIRRGSEVRKQACEDAKVNNPERGLFVVADGVGGLEAGDMASRVTAEVLFEDLGEELDLKIESIVKSRAPEDRKKALVDQLVRDQIQNAVRRAHSLVKQKAGELKGKMAATTLSATKLVELPGGGQRLYVANVGDSRVYLVANKRLHRLTVDDSELVKGFKDGQITKEEMRMLDQHPGGKGDFDHDSRLKQYFRSSVVTEAVGYTKKPEQVSVDAYDVNPGDRVVITGDGVHDTLLDSEILEHMTSDQSALQTERNIQNSTDALIGRPAGRRRVKADDVSAVVVDIGESGPDREYLKHLPKPEVVTEFTLADARSDLETARGALSEFEQTSTPSDRSEQSEHQARGLDLEAAEKRAEIMVAKMALSELEQNYPARFKGGDGVRVWRDDFADPSYDPKLWTVDLYNPRTQEYQLSQFGSRAMRKVDRFTVEREQADTILSEGDQINVDGEYALVTRIGKEVKLERQEGESSVTITIRPSDAELFVGEMLMDGQRLLREIKDKERIAGELSASAKNLRANRDRIQQRALEEKARSAATG
jgi:PPM family protein phosphatase